MNAANSTTPSDEVEWLEADGLGGFASGTANGVRTRRYHALLLKAASPPTGRCVLVNGYEAWIEAPAGRWALSTQRYVPDVLCPDGASRLKSFSPEPWPTWTWRLPTGADLCCELFVPHERSVCVLAWKLTKPARSARLVVRPLLSGRNYHALHRENGAFRFEPLLSGSGVTWKPYDPIPATTALSNGGYTHDPEWYRQFLYRREQERGLDCVEDLASPGTFAWELAGEAVLIFAAAGDAEQIVRLGATPVEVARALRESERNRRAAFSTRLARSADAYVVRRGSGKTIVAGYPWFTDWGRDTFISLRGLCLATGRLDEARDILAGWARTISEGMLPNRFPDEGNSPEYNSVDASLWYVVAVHDYLAAVQAAGRALPIDDVRVFRDAVQRILTGYFRGTRFGIRGADDGLLSCGVPGSQVTWMDSKIGDWVVTPRAGKPVEVQALWLSALRIGSTFDKQWSDVYDRGLVSFRSRFWNEARGCLYDVIDVDHQPGAVDARLRPNQVFAVGGLPWSLLDPKRGRSLLDVVEAKLWTPLGLRTLEPGGPGYRPQYVGGVEERAAAYHQGTVWPWLAGPFIEGWVRVRGCSPQSCNEARAKFVAPLLARLEVAGLGHLTEVADADPPHAPRGCPFQAWSLGELLRTTECVLNSHAP